MLILQESLVTPQSFFLDDNENICQCGNYPVIGKSFEASRMDTDIIVGIGNADIRKRIQESFPEERIVTLSGRAA